MVGKISYFLRWKALIHVRSCSIYCTNSSKALGKTCCIHHFLLKHVVLLDLPSISWLCSVLNATHFHGTYDGCLICVWQGQHLVECHLSSTNLYMSSDYSFIWWRFFQEHSIKVAIWSAACVSTYPKPSWVNHPHWGLEHLSIYGHV